MHRGHDSLIFHLFSGPGRISEQPDAGLSWETIRLIFFEKTVYVCKPVKKGIAFSGAIEGSMQVREDRNAFSPGGSPVPSYWKQR